MFQPDEVQNDDEDEYANAPAFQLGLEDDEEVGQPGDGEGGVEQKERKRLLKKGTDSKSSRGGGKITKKKASWLGEDPSDAKALHVDSEVIGMSCVAISSLLYLIGIQLSSRMTTKE